MPTELDRILAKAMAKDPNERYQHIEDMLVDLRALRTGLPARRRLTAPTHGSRRRTVWASAGVFIVVAGLAAGLNGDRLRDALFGGGAAKIESIAILPLQNLSGDTEQQYFSDGMTEALYTDLAKISTLKVISPRSAQKYEGTNAAIRQIAAELGVEAIVQGSATRTGERARITAQLIDARTDTSLWAESFERDFTDVLMLQAEVAQAVAQQVRAQLTPAEAIRLAQARSVNPEAYESYLKGQFYERQLTPEAIDTALWHYESALEKDPNYALAYAGITFSWLARQQMGLVPPKEASPQAAAAAKKAMELDESLAESHQALGSVRFYVDWDWEGAEVEYRRAIELNPNYPYVYVIYSHLLMALGRETEAMKHIDRALESDPFNTMWQAFRGMDLYFGRRYDDAIAQFQRAVKTDPNQGLAHYGLWYGLHEKRVYAEAFEGAAKAYEAAGHPEVREFLESGYKQGGYPAAMSVLAETLAERFQTDRIGVPVDIAHMYMYAGKKEQALEWLERSFDFRDRGCSGFCVSFVLREDRRTSWKRELSWKRRWTSC